MYNVYKSDYEALAYGRFTWSGVPDEVGDVERIMTWYDGVSVVTDDGRLLPVKVPLDMCEPWRAPYIKPTGGTRADGGRYPWSRLITVAPARKIITTLRDTLAELDDTQIKLTALAKITRAVKTKDATKGDVKEIVDGTYAGIVPVMTVDGSFDRDDIIDVGDGETHAQGVNDMQIVALARACTALGVSLDAVIKAERVITDEAQRTAQLVDLVRANEIRQRLKLASWTGWTFTINF